jgi:hypothetical protein
MTTFCKDQESFVRSVSDAIEELSRGKLKQITIERIEMGGSVDVMNMVVVPAYQETRINTANWRGEAK